MTRHKKERVSKKYLKRGVHNNKSNSYDLFYPRYVPITLINTLHVFIF